MRWLLGRDPGDCSACGAALVRGASWCGMCGAATSQPVEEHVEEADVAETEAAPVSATGRRVGVVLLVVAVLGALVVAGATRTPPPEPLLGTPEGLGGMSSTGPPPSGLQLAWRHDLPGEQFPGSFSSWGVVRVRGDDELVAVDGRVVDRASGRLVRLDPWQRPDGVWIEGDTIVRSDSLTGEEVELGTLPTSDLGWPSLVTDGIVVLTSDEQVTLLRVDGTEVATVDGQFHGHLDRAEAEPAVLPVRARPGSPDDAVHLVDPSDGSIVRTLEHDRGAHAVDVVGETVLHVRTDSSLGSPGAGVDWRVEVLDPDTGMPIAPASRVTSAHTPRLVGSLADGSVVVGSRSGAQLSAWLVRPGASTDEPFLTVRAAGTNYGDVYGHGDGDILAQLLVVDEHVVVNDGEREQVRAVDVTGRGVWRVEGTGVTRIGGGDGLVALLRDDVGPQEDRSARVIDARDGSSVAVVPPGIDQYQSGRGPALVHEGHLALGDRGHWFGGVELQLQSTVWLDLRDGDRVLTDDVLERVLPEDVSATGSWLLHGVTRSADAAPAPVITRGLDSDSVQLLDPGVGFETIDLGRGGAGGVAGYYAQVVGISAEHVVLTRADFDSGTETSHVIDRATGDVLDLEGVSALGLFGDLVLAIDLEGIDGPSWTRELVALDVSDGSERWRIENAEEVLFQDVVARDHDTIASVGRREAALLDLSDGSTPWRRAVGETLLSWTPVLGAKHLAVVTTSGVVIALDREDGSEVWRTPVGTPVTSMTGAGDDVLVGTVDGLVVHLDARGREVQRVAVGTGAVTSLASLGDTVVAAVDEGIIGLRADGAGIVRQDQVDLP